MKGFRFTRVGAWFMPWILLLLLTLRCGVVSAAPVTVLKVQDAIGPASADYIVRGMAQAHRSGSPLVVIELDTPGGLDTSMRQIIQAILASPVPVATYVSPAGARAASAGTYILYASHIAAMAPSTTMGAATPVEVGMPGAGDRKPPGQAASAPPRGKAQPEDAAAAKRVHDAAAFIRGLAQRHGRNADWAERAVRDAVSLTAQEALQQNVVDVVARDVPDLLAKIDGRRVTVPSGEVTLNTRGAAFEVVPPDWRHRLLSVIANPSFALILIMIGIYGLMFEFASPTFGVAGVVGAISLLLGLFALQVLPTNYAGLALILLGVALMAAEVVTPALGVLGAGGVIAFIAGGVLLFDRDVPGMGVPLPLLLGLATASVTLAILGGGMAMRARGRPVQTGVEQMLGATGQVLDVRNNEEAWALVRGERWQVRSSSPLIPGQGVRVVSMRGLALDVVPDMESPMKEGTQP